MLSRALFVLTWLGVWAGAAASQNVTMSSAMRIEAPAGTGKVTDLAIGRDGKIYILDGKHARILRLSPAGIYERTLGDHGANAGEISLQARQVLTSQSHVFVVDPGNQRITAFRMDGTFAGLRELSLRESLAVKCVAVFEQIACLIPPLPPGFGFEDASNYDVVLIDPLGKGTRRLLTLPTAPAVVRLDAGTPGMNLDVPKPLIAALSGDGVLMAMSDTFRITHVDVQGSATEWMVHDAPRRRYTAAEQERIRAVADSANQAAYAAASPTGGQGIRIDYGLPQFAPAVDAVIAGDDLVLVGHTGVSGDWRWDAFDRARSFLGRLGLPPDFEVLAARGRRVWGIQRGGGVERISAFDLGKIPTRQPTEN